MAQVGKYPNAQQVAFLARFGGFSGNAELTMAIAVCYAENGGRPYVDAISPTGDYGLWQINLHYHPQYTRAEMFDPLQNAAAAYAISNHGTDWTPWSTYKSGAYKRYLGLAESTVKKYGGILNSGHGTVKDPQTGKTISIGSDNPINQAVGGAVKAAAAPISWAEGLANFLAEIAQASFWLRVIEVLGGIICISAGVVLLGKEEIMSLPKMKGASAAE